MAIKHYVLILASLTGEPYDNISLDDMTGYIDPDKHTESNILVESRNFLQNLNSKNLYSDTWTLFSQLSLLYGEHHET